jgi:hypothetical protein
MCEFIAVIFLAKSARFHAGNMDNVSQIEIVKETEITCTLMLTEWYPCDMGAYGYKKVYYYTENKSDYQDL